MHHQYGVSRLNRLRIALIQWSQLQCGHLKFGPQDRTKNLNWLLRVFQSTILTSTRTSTHSQSIKHFLTSICHCIRMCWSLSSTSRSLRTQQQKRLWPSSKGIRIISNFQKWSERLLPSNLNSLSSRRKKLRLKLLTKGLSNIGIQALKYLRSRSRSQKIC